MATTQAGKNGRQPDPAAATTPSGSEPTASVRVSPQRFTQAVRPMNIPGRLGEVATQQAKDAALGALRVVPRLRRTLDRPRTQPLRSGSIFLYRWWKAPYGSLAKPRSVGEIPWDYVEANQDTIPFLGLREYWYPAFRSRSLRNNTPKPVTMLGDNLVFFRDGSGRVRALENRCAHRAVMLSLGQVGIFEPGTITCRYHGMTFDGDGECVAYLVDGPDSPACGKIRVRSYPVEEHGGMVWVYMGEKKPEPFLDSHPHARSVLSQPSMFLHSVDLPYSHLNMLDNSIDLAHPSCLHRNCLIFGGQKPFGEIGVTEMECGGIQARFTDAMPHSGQFHIDQIEWHLPNHVYHAPGDLGGGFGEGWFWPVPRDVGSFTAWFVIGQKGSGPFRRALASSLTEIMFSRSLPWPGSAQSCLEGGDAPMMASQGRVARWDQDRLTRPDVGIAKVRRTVQAAHAAEVAERAARGAKPPRLRRPRPATAPVEPN